MYEAFRRSTSSSLKRKTLVEGPFDGSRTVVALLPGNRTDFFNYIPIYIYIYIYIYMDITLQKFRLQE